MRPQENRPEAHRSVRLRPLTVLALIVSLVGAALGMPFSPAPSAGAIGSFDNASVADIALRYVGRYGGAACVDAGRSGHTGGTPLGAGNNDDGECRAFLNCVVRLASGSTMWVGGGSDYFSALAANGTRITSLDDLRKGDVVQIGQGIHTTIIVARKSGNVFTVVDSNHGRDHIVRTYDRAITLDDTSRAYRLGTVTNGASASPTFGASATEQSRFVGRLIHHPDGTVDYVAATGFRYWVPSGDIVNCLGGWGSVLNVSAAEFTSLPRNTDGDPGGKWADCGTGLVGRLIKGSGPRVDYVASTGQRYYVPSGDVVNCLGGWGSLRSVTDGQFNSIPENPYGAWANCSSAIIGRLIHHPDGTVDYVSAAHIRYWVPDGNTVNCLGGWGSVKNLSAEHFVERPRNARNQWADCNTSLFNRLIRKADGTVDYVSGSGERYWVPDGNTVTCLGGWTSVIFLADNRFNAIRRNAAGAWSDCGTVSRT